MGDTTPATPADQRKASPPVESPAADPRRRTRPDWRWRSFPVFAAFVSGILLAFLVNEGSVNPAAFVLQIAALLGVGYSLAHLFATNVIAAGRTRRADRDDETEDVVVYPDE
jgi:hypothetical protein